jgi:hypothetical protein
LLSLLLLLLLLLLCVRLSCCCFSYCCCRCRCRFHCRCTLQKYNICCLQLAPWALTLYCHTRALSIAATTAFFCFQEQLEQLTEPAREDAGILVGKIEAVSKQLPPARAAVAKASAKVHACAQVMQRLQVMKNELQSNYHAAMLSKPLVSRRSRRSSVSDSASSAGDSDGSPARAAGRGYARLNSVDVSDSDEERHMLTTSVDNGEAVTLTPARSLDDMVPLDDTPRTSDASIDGGGDNGMVIKMRAAEARRRPGDVGPLVSKMDAWNLRLLGDKLKQTDGKLQRATDEWRRCGKCTAVALITM